MIERKPDGSLIDLQTAHVTQFTEHGIRGDWLVRQNVSSDDLAKLPGELTEKQVFAVMAFARRFELEAFNAGIEFQKDQENAIHKQAIAELQARLEAAIHRANVLAQKYESVTNEE